MKCYNTSCIEFDDSREYNCQKGDIPVSCPKKIEVPENLHKVIRNLEHTKLLQSELIIQLKEDLRCAYTTIKELNAV